LFGDKPAYLILSLCVLLAVLLTYWIVERFRNRFKRSSPPPRSSGLAIAKVLDGDLAEARAILEEKTSANGVDFVDGLIGLVAVLRKQGEVQRARTLLEQLGEHEKTAWVDELKVRLCLDTDDLAAALEYVENIPDIPLEIALATLARCQLWDDALDLYRKRVNRKVRASDLEANLMAGAAIKLFQVQRDKVASKQLKKATNLNGDAQLVLLGNTLYSESKSVRDSAKERLLLQWPWFFTDTLETSTLVPTSDVLERSRTQWNAGEKSSALGLLRDCLEAEPNDWVVRRQYVTWILDGDDPLSWRAELADLIERLKSPMNLTIKGYCQDCGLEGHTLVTVCPRCDAIGRFGRNPVAGKMAARYLEHSLGASVSDLVEDTRNI